MESGKRTGGSFYANRRRAEGCGPEKQPEEGVENMDMPDNKNAEMREKTGPRRALLKTARLSLSGARKDRRRP